MSHRPATTDSPSPRHRAVIPVIAAVLIVLAPCLAQAAPLANASFETGDLSGWTIDGVFESFPPYVATTHQSGASPTYTAPSGNYFAVVPGGCSTQTILQNFDASAGSTMSGWAFFQAFDYDPYLDSATVKLIVSSSGQQHTLFYSDVTTVGDNGYTPWMPWSYTFPADGAYQVRVESSNNRDCLSSSVIGFDINETPAVEMLYVNNNSDPNMVSALHVASDGTLFLAGVYPTGGSAYPPDYATETIAVIGNFLFAANSVDGTITTFAINPVDGTLAATGIIGAFGAQAWSAIGLEPTPDGNYLIASSRNDSFVMMLSVDGLTGELTPMPASWSSILNPLSMRASPDGKWLAVTSAVNNGVYVFAISGATLTPLLWSPFSTELGGAVNGAPAGLRYNAASTRLFVAIGNESATWIGMFSVDPVTGQLFEHPSSPFNIAGGGVNSNIALLSSDEQFLFISNQYSSTFTTAAVAGDGSLLPASGPQPAGGEIPSAMVLNEAGSMLFSAEGFHVSSYGVAGAGLSLISTAALPADAIAYSIARWSNAGAPVPLTLDPIGDRTTQWGDELTFTAQGSGGSGTWTYAIDAPPAGSSFDESTGVFTWTPTWLQLSGSPFSVTISVTDGTDTVSETIEITVTKRATTLTYNGDTKGQYSDEVTLSATVTDASTGEPIPALAVSFDLGSQSVSPDPETDAYGVASGTLVLDQAATTSSVIADFAGTTTYFGATDTETFEIAKEDVYFDLDPDNPTAVQVTSPGGTAAPVTLCADFYQADDGFDGDLALATPITFILNGFSGGGTANLPAIVTGSGTVRTACVTTAALAVDAYDVTINVGGNYFTGGTSTVLAVFDPSLGFATGGGTVVRDGVRSTFAFNVKYVRKNIQGGAIYIEHHPMGEIVKVKSNALISLSINGNKAAIVTKANVTGHGGNYTMIVTGVDNGTPGIGVDLYGLQVNTPGGSVVGSLTFAPVPIAGGNIQVPQPKPKK